MADYLMNGCHDGMVIICPLIHKLSSANLKKTNNITLGNREFSSY